MGIKAMRLLKKIKTLLDKDTDTAYVDETNDAEEGYSSSILDQGDYRFLDVLHAITKGDIETVRHYLEFDARYAQCHDWEEHTLLHQAALYAQTDIVTLLLQNNADLEALHQGQTPLHYAINTSMAWVKTKRPDVTYSQHQAAQIDTIKILLDQQADLHAFSDHGENALHIAARLGSYNAIALLLNRGAELDSRTLAPYIEDDDESPIQKPIQSAKRTALLLAARHSKHAKLIMFLLEKGADVNAIDTDPGYSVLHYLASMSRFEQIGKEKALAELTRQCLKHGANPNLRAKGKKQETPLHLAAINNHVYLANILIKAGANKQAKTRKGLTPMSVAAQQGLLPMMKCLYQQDLDINESCALFHAATYVGSTQVMEWVLEQGADINQVDTKNSTALFYAISAGAFNNIQFLLKHKIDLKLHPVGYTPSQHAFAYWGTLEAKPDSQKDPEKLAEAKKIIDLLGGFDSLKKNTKIG
jgi:ankyrin